MTERIYPPGVAALYTLNFPNGKVYIGISTNPRKRMRLHKAHALRGSGHLVHRALRKYGPDTVQPRTIAVGPRDYILELEQKAIAAFGTRNPKRGYNLTAGGEANPMDSKRVRSKVSRALTGRKDPEAVRAKKKASWDPARRAAMSALHRGKAISAQQIEKTRATKAKRPKKTIVRKTAEEIRRVRSAATLRTYSDRRLSWMPAKKALKHWLNPYLKSGEALALMSGWTAREARKKLGCRPRPKKFTAMKFRSAKVRIARGEALNSISRRTGISWTHLNRLKKAAEKNG